MYYEMIKGEYLVGWMECLSSLHLNSLFVLFYLYSIYITVNNILNCL